METNEVIEESQSYYARPAFRVQKKTSADKSCHELNGTSYEDKIRVYNFSDVHKSSNHLA